MHSIDGGSKMTIKGVLFDKDGTLIKFKEIWVPMAYELIDDLLEIRNEHGNETLRNELAQSIGLQHQEINEFGALASGTTMDIATQFSGVLSVKVDEIYGWLAEGLQKKTAEKRNCILPTCDLDNSLSILKEKGIVMGVATSDDYESTKICLKQIGVDLYFDFIGTGDRFRKKPDSHVVEAFCEKYGLAPEEVAIVGDTICDMKLSKNSKSGCSVGVLSGVGSAETLGELAGFIVPSIDGIILDDGKLIWEA